MRTGYNYWYRYSLIHYVLPGNERLVIGLVGTGGPQRTPPMSAGPGRPRRVVVDDESAVFAFTATRGRAPDEVLNGEPSARARWPIFGREMRERVETRGDEGLRAWLAAYDRKRQRFVCGDPIDGVVNVTPSSGIAALAERLYREHVLELTGAELKRIEPPGVWARELGCVTVVPATLGWTTDE